MKIVISPSKSLDWESKLPTTKSSYPRFLKQSEIIQQNLKEKSPKELSELMNISEKLGELNYIRNQNWQPPFMPENARPAIFAFNGDVYEGLDPYTLNSQQIDILQQKLRILSGLYGLLKPLDLIQPYRLEMGTKIAVAQSRNLYEFWKQTLTQALNEELSVNELFVNLASKEYADALDFSKLNARIVVPEFKDYKDGKLKTISFYAKRARGLMVRYIIENNCTTIEDLKGFDSEQYRYDDNLSTEKTLVFTR